MAEWLIDGVWNLLLACQPCNRGPRGKFARLDRNKFYRRQDFSEQLEPFALEHVSAQFALWGAGLALAAAVLCCCERGRERAGKGKVIVVEARGKREGVK